jgi:hypothetical protein
MAKKGVNMSQKAGVLSSVDSELVRKYKDKSIKHHITTKLGFNINVAGTDFNSIEEAIIHAYRCGLASVSSDQSKKSKATVDQDELYRKINQSHSREQKADFLREIAREWSPIEPHSEKKIKKVHIELNELADFLEE